MKITVREAMQDFRQELVGRIMRGYPDHKKMWKAEEVAVEITAVMFDLSIEYLERA